MATLDLPHMIATGLIVFAVIWLIENLKALDGVSKGRKTKPTGAEPLQVGVRMML